MNKVGDGHAVGEGAFARLGEGDDGERKLAMTALPTLSPVAQPERLGGNADPVPRRTTGAARLGWPCFGHVVVVKCEAYLNGLP